MSRRFRYIQAKQIPPTDFNRKYFHEFLGIFETEFFSHFGDFERNFISDRDEFHA